MVKSEAYEISRQNARSILAIIMVLISALAIGIAPICAKLAYLGGSNSYSLITARNLMMTTCLGLGLLCFGRSFRLPKNSLIIALAMGPIYVLVSFGYLGAVVSPTWFSTWPFSHPEAGVQAVGSTR